MSTVDDDTQSPASAHVEVDDGSQGELDAGDAGDYSESDDVDLAMESFPATTKHPDGKAGQPAPGAATLLAGLKVPPYYVMVPQALVLQPRNQPPGGDEIKNNEEEVTFPDVGSAVVTPEPMATSAEPDLHPKLAEHAAPAATSPANYLDQDVVTAPDLLAHRKRVREEHLMELLRGLAPHARPLVSLPAAIRLLTPPCDRPPPMHFPMHDEQDDCDLGQLGLYAHVDGDDDPEAPPDAPSHAPKGIS